MSENFIMEIPKAFKKGFCRKLTPTLLWTRVSA